MAAGWSVLDALNKNSKAAAVEDVPKARFRSRDISIKKMYSNDKNFYSMQDIEELAGKILAVGLLENMVVTYDPCDEGEYRIIAGERRWRALNLLVGRGYEEFEIATCQIKSPMEEHEERVQIIIANAYRSKTVMDVLEEEKQLKQSLQYMKDNKLKLQGYDLNSGRLRDVIANIMNTTTTRIAQIESINKRLIPEFTKELQEGRLTFSAAYELSGMEEGKQQEMLLKFKETGELTYTDVKRAKEEAKAAEAAKQIEGQMEYPEDYEQDAQEGTETDEGDDMEDSSAEEENDEYGANQDATDGEEWQQAHPESITSLCYGCQRYSDCNVRTSTCTSCDRYINKAEAEKTDEQRYNEEQDAIDKETAKKLREMQDEERMNHLPSDAAKEQKVHQIRLGAQFFGDVLEGRKKFELRKNDRGYKVGDILEMMEFKDGRNTGRIVRVNVVYMLEDFTGLEEGYCIMGTELIPEEGDAQ